jgi:hypothetical protein
MTGFDDAIASIESGGRYDLLGPLTRAGDRAYGKYQVMGANVGPWTKEVLGQSLTPEEFLASPEAQDAVFNAKFGNYVAKYGPEGAARAWFAGEGGMNDPSRKDILGTSVADYGRRFMAALGQGGAAASPSAVPQATPLSANSLGQAQGAPLPLFAPPASEPAPAQSEPATIPTDFFATLPASLPTNQPSLQMLLARPTPVRRGFHPFYPRST